MVYFSYIQITKPKPIITMRRLSLFICFLFFLQPIFGEEKSDTSNIHASLSNKREFKLYLTNRKGKPIRDNTILVYHTGNKNRVMPLDRNGSVIFNDVTHFDTLNIVMGGGYYSILLEDMDSLNLIVRSKKLLSNNPTLNKIIDDGYSSVDKDRYNLPADVLKMANTHGYSNLADYMTGRVAGLTIEKAGEGYTAFIRGKSSFITSSEPLVIVDGVQMLSFDQAVQMVNVKDVESVNVLKDGAIYGSRGANGIIIIKTKTGR